jgi:hypothetical protein
MLATKSINFILFHKLFLKMQQPSCSISDDNENDDEFPFCFDDIVDEPDKAHDLSFNLFGIQDQVKFMKYDNVYQDDNQGEYYHQLKKDVEYFQRQFADDMKCKDTYFDPDDHIALDCTNQNEFMKEFCSLLQRHKQTLNTTKKFFNQYSFKHINNRNKLTFDVLLKINRMVEDSCHFFAAHTSEQFMAFIQQLIRMQNELTEANFRFFGSCYANLIHQTFPFTYIQTVPSRQEIHEHIKYFDNCSMFSISSDVNCTSRLGHKVRVIGLPLTLSPTISEYCSPAYGFQSCFTYPNKIIHINNISSDHFDFCVIPAEFSNKQVLHSSSKQTIWKWKSTNEIVVPPEMLSSNFLHSAHHQQILRSGNRLPCLYVFNGVTNEDTLASLRANHKLNFDADYKAEYNSFELDQYYKRVLSGCWATYEVNHAVLNSLQYGCRSTQYSVIHFIEPYIKLQYKTSVHNMTLNSRTKYLCDQAVSIKNFATQLPLFQLMFFNQDLMFESKSNCWIYKHLHLTSQIVPSNFQGNFPFNNSMKLFRYLQGIDSKCSVVHDIDYIHHHIQLYSIVFDSIKFFKKWLNSLRAQVFVSSREINGLETTVLKLQPSYYTYSCKNHQNEPTVHNHIHNVYFKTFEMNLFPNGWRTIYSHYIQCHMELFVWYHLLIKLRTTFKYLSTQPSISTQVLQNHILPFLSLSL